MKIDLLYIEDCPSWRQGLENLKSALAAERIEAVLHLVRVKNDNEATRFKFLGSPSFQINGVDLWPDNRSSYRLSCRIYASPDGMIGFPTVAMLQEKLRNLH